MMYLDRGDDTKVFWPHMRDNPASGMVMMMLYTHHCLNCNDMSKQWSLGPHPGL